MSENEERKNQLRAQLERGGVMLDEAYVARARELYNAAVAAGRESKKNPDIPNQEVEADMEKADRCAPSRHLAVKISILALFILSVASLLLPLDPFASRLPIAGVFAGVGGIVLFAFLLGADKRREKNFAYHEILRKYGVDSADGIPAAVSRKRQLKKEAEETSEKLLTFVRFAAPGVSTHDDCGVAIRTVEAMLREYRRL